MFVINLQLPESESGVYPQVDNMGVFYDWDKVDSITRLTANSELSFIPDFQTFTLDRKAVLTDVLSQSFVSSPGLLISKKVRDTFKAMKIQDHIYYDAKVNYQGSILEYYWMHFSSFYEQSVDYEQSNFNLFDMFSHQVGQESFGSLSEFESRCCQLALGLTGQMVPNKLYSSQEFDLFVVTTNEPIYFVSDELAKRLIDSRVSGLELVKSPLEVVIGRW